MTNKVLYTGLNPANYQTDGELTHLPLIEIIPRPQTDPDVQSMLAAFAEYTHVIVTSKSTVDILKGYVALEDWKKKITIAVGQITAKYLNEMGVVPAIIAAEETAEGIIEALKKLDLSRAFVFWPHAALARPLIANHLYSQNIPYAECILYDTKFLVPTSLPDLAPYNEIVFTSPSTVDAFLKLYGTFPLNKKLTPIGPITENRIKTRAKGFEG